jgi:hypothetical protein
MSNVLIGIIGVILFIGLALAGALILGDDFRTATSSSQAASVMSQMKQAADAADMRKLKTGVAYTPAIPTDFLVPRFLKSPAVNTSSWSAANRGVYMSQIEFNNNIYGDSGPEPAVAALYVQAVIGPVGDEKSRATCQSISETYGNAAIPDYTGNNFPAPAAPTGCIIAQSVSGTYFIAYQRMERADMNTSTPSGY